MSNQCEVSNKIALARFMMDFGNEDEKNEAKEEIFKLLKS